MPVSLSPAVPAPSTPVLAPPQWSPRRRRRISPAEVAFGVIAAILLALLGGQARYFLAVGVAVLILLALLRPSATLTAEGIRIRPWGRLPIRGRQLAWSEISAIDAVQGWRSRYVRVFRSGRNRAIRLAAIGTTVSRPDPRYPADL